MKQATSFLIIITFFILISCNKKNLSGVYVGNFSNNKDSLILLNEGNYKRVIYDNNDEILIEQNGLWKIVESDGMNVELSNFYINENEKNPVLNYKYEAVYLPIEYFFFSKRLIVNYDFNRYYEKK